MLFALRELLDVFIMTGAVGYIFMDLFRPNKYAAFDWNVFKFACLVTAPALIFHELAHKLVAIGAGHQATFHAAYFWLGLGIMLKLLRFNFIFFVPAYVSIAGSQIEPLSGSLIAFAGPFLNFVLFIAAWSVLKYKKKLSKKTYTFLYVTKQINLFLFIFNMLPIPFFDGSKVYAGLIKVLF